MQGEDAVDALDFVRLDDVLGTPGERLLCRLEDQPGSAGQQSLLLEIGEDQRRPDLDGCMQVMTAGMGDARNRRPVGDLLLVGDGERVHVRSERDRRPVLADIAYESGTDREDASGQTGLFQAVSDDPRRAYLGECQLRMSMKIAAQRDQLGGILLSPHREVWRRLCGDPHRTHGRESTAPSWVTSFPTQSSLHAKPRIFVGRSPAKTHYWAAKSRGSAARLGSHDRPEAVGRVLPNVGR